LSNQSLSESKNASKLRIDLISLNNTPRVVDIECVDRGWKKDDFTMTFNGDLEAAELKHIIKRRKRN